MLMPSLFRSFRRNGLLSTSAELCSSRRLCGDRNRKRCNQLFYFLSWRKKKQHNTNTGNNETRNKQCKRTCSRSAKGKKKVYRGLLAVFFGSFVFFASSDGEQPQRMHKTERTGWTISVDVNLHINQPGHLRTPINKITFSYYWFTNFDSHRRRE